MGPGGTRAWNYATNDLIIDAKSANEQKRMTTSMNVMMMMMMMMIKKKKT